MSRYRETDAARTPSPAEQLADAPLFAPQPAQERRGPAPWARHGPEHVRPPAARLSDPETAHEAARNYLGDAEKQNAMIEACLRGMGQRGGTAPEIAEALGWTSVQVSRRISALRDAQLVYTFDGLEGRPLVKRLFPGHRACAVHVAWAYRDHLPPAEGVAA